MYKDFCVINCPVNYVATKDGNCVKCIDDHCSRCKEDRIECEFCIEPYMKYKDKCVKKCPIRSYYFNGNCIRCPLYCLFCNSEGCLKCTRNKFLNENKQCVDKCPLRSVEVDEVCVKCQTLDTCIKCDSRNIKRCRECIDNFYLFEGSCLDKCPDGYYSYKGICRSILIII